VSDLVAVLEALGIVERQALTLAWAQLRDEDVDAGRHDRAAVWAALVDVAADATQRECSTFAELEAGFWRVEDGGVGGAG